MNPVYLVAVVTAVTQATACTLADAHMSHEEDPAYLNIEVNMTEYERTVYADFDLIRISLDIINENPWGLNYSTFTLGGEFAAFTDDSTFIPNEEYAPVSAEYVWNLNISILPNDCASSDQWSEIPASSMESVLLCFVVERSFLPNGLMVGGESGHRIENGFCYSGGSGHYYQRAHYNTEWPFCAIHVVPLRDDSTYCDRYSMYCNRGNIQSVAKAVVDEAPADTIVAASNGDPLGPGTLFMASATILGLAVFGSVLSTRIRRKPKNKDISWYARVLLPLSILALIGVQAWFMLHLAESFNVQISWQLDPSTVYWWIFLMILCSIGVTFFVTLANSAPTGKTSDVDPYSFMSPYL